MSRKHRKKSMISFSLFLVVLGIIIFSNNYIQGKVEKSFNVMNLQVLAINDSLNEEDEELEDEGIENVVDTVDNNIQKEEKPKQVVYDYIGKLVIPKIDLERGFVSKNSRYNSVSYGIETLGISEYPNVNKGNLILLSHSGTSYRSFFKNLYKLELGDDCYVEYQGVKYHYIIKKIYNMPKTGKVAIRRDYDKTTLTLITCTHDSKTEQTIYIAELV